MPADVENAVYANQPAWHGLGTVIDTGGEKGITVAKAIELSGLTYEVEKVPIFDGDGKAVDRRYGVRRNDNRLILGVVGEQWEPVQNIEGFSIIQDVIDQAAGTMGTRVWIESAGALDEGRKAWILAHVDDDWQIAGEAYKSYFLFAVGHDGRMAVTAATVDMRVVCSNTLEYAISGEAKQTGRVVRVRHTASAGERIKQAHGILGMRNLRKEELAKQGEWLVEQTMTDEQFAGFLEELMPIREDQDEKPAGTMIRNKRSSLAQVYFDAPNLAPIRGTRWAALQATIEQDQHRKGYRSEENRAWSQFGMSQADIPQRAVALLSR